MARSTRRRLALRPLEDRVVPAVGDFVHTFDPPAGASSAGDGLAVNDQFVVMGDPGSAGGGTVHLYYRLTESLFNTIPNPAPAAGDYFGGHVAISGDYLAVSALWDDTDGTDTGIVYVFRTTTGQLLQTLHNPTIRTDGGLDLFGAGLAISGDTVYVGAPWDDQHGGNAAGAVYRWSLSTGNYLGELASPNPHTGAQFGWGLAATDRWVAVGGMTDDPVGQMIGAGAVHLYDPATGQLVRSIYNPQPSPAADQYDYFGGAVALDGNTLVVGADAHDDGIRGSDRGAAFVFNAATGDFVRKLANPAPASETGDRFGMSVAVANHVVVVGAPWGTPGGPIANNHGTAYAFDADTGDLLATLANPADAGTSAWFGIDTAALGDRLFVSAINDGGGKVHEFEGGPYDPPDAIDDTATVPQDSPGQTIDVRANDMGAFPASLSISAVTQPQHGTVNIVADNSQVEYIPAPGYGGPDSFTYTISDSYGSDTATVNIAVTPVHPPPNAIEDTATVAEDSGATAIDVRANDVADDPALLAVTGVAQPQHGTVAITPDGTRVTYTPDPNYNGPDSFTYTVTDPNGSDTATVNVTVTPVNDPPTAVNDVATVYPDSGANPIEVLANDSDAPDTGEILTITAVTQPTHGTVVITGNGTGLTYTLFDGYHGADGFTYTISDGNGGTATAAVSVTVIPAPGNHPPTAVVDTAAMVEDSGTLSIDVLANDTTAPDTGETLSVRLVTRAAHGTTAVVADGKSVTYTPDPDFAGTDTFYYVVSDGRGERASAPVVVTVTNDAADRLEVVPSAGTTEFREGDGGQVLDAGLRVGTAAGGLVKKAVIRFATGYVKGRDVLSFAAMNGIKGKFSPATGTLTLTGKAAPSAYRDALRTVQYANRSDDPVAGSRTVVITLFDAAGTGEPGYRAVHVTAVDDAPNVTLPATAVAAKVGKPAVALAGLKLVDPDSAFLRGATVTITNVQAGDVLAAVTGNTGLTAVFQNGTLTIRGTASVATYLKVLRSVTFTAAGGAGIVRTLSVTIDDGDLIGDPATRPVTVA